MEESTTQNSSESPQELNTLLRKLNKPEMLLLNHLQNQLKLYYPDQVRKNKLLQEELGLATNLLDDR
jgi:hypothetical protein